MGVISWCNVGHAALIHHFQSLCESGTLAVRLKIQCCINKARDTLPTFSFALISWSRERFLSSSLPALTQNYGDVFTRHVWACVCVRTQPPTHITCMYACLRLCVAPCVALTTCCRFSFCLPLESRADSHQRRNRNRNRGRMEHDIVPGFSVWHPQLSHLLSPVEQQM